MCSTSVIGFIERYYGLSKPVIYNLVNCYKKFCVQIDRKSLDVETPRFKPEFEGFNLSKLFELFPVPETLK